MKDKEFEKIIDLVWQGGGFLPCNEKANDLTETLGKGQIVSFLECTQRDLSFHKCYMALLAYIWGYMPPKFKKTILKKDFYQWLKHLQGKYKIKYEFKDGSKFVEYESITFGNMSQQRFKEYVKEQIPFIYENVIGAYFEGEIYDNIITTIEADFERFFDKLDK
jgi:hypothetical protein